MGFVIENAEYIAGAFAAIKIGSWVAMIPGIGAKMGVLFSIVKAGIPYILSLGRVLLVALGPWGLAIAGAIAAGYLIYNNWDMIQGKIIELKNTFMNVYNGVSGSTDTFLGKMINLAIKIGQFVFAPIKAGLQLLRGDFTGAVATMKSSWSGLSGALTSVTANMWAGIKAYFSQGIAGILADLENLAMQAANYTTFGAAGAIAGAAGYRNPADRAASSAVSGYKLTNIAVTVNGEVKGAKMQAPSVKTTQSGRGKGNNSPVVVRR